jgi:drug/metabolite transporter (DMT)-like permease
VLLLIAANLLWGSGWVVAKLALAELSPLQVSAWRMLLAGAFAVPWLLLLLRREVLPRVLWPRLILLGGLGFVASKFLNFWGLARTSASDASLLMAAEPMLTIALGVLVLRESLGRRRLAAFSLGAAGSYLIIAGGLRWPDLAAAHFVGNLVFVSGLLGEAAYSVFGKALLDRHSPVLITAATVVASLAFWAPVAAVDVATSGWPQVSGRGMAAMLFLALGCTLLAYWAWFRALEELEAGRAALTIFIQPLWGALLAISFLGERLGGSTLAGAALTLGGLYLALAGKR